MAERQEDRAERSSAAEEGLTLVRLFYRNRVKGNGGLRFAHALGCLLKSDEGEGSDFARLQGQAVINHLNRMKMNGGPPFFYTR